MKVTADPADGTAGRVRRRRPHRHPGRGGLLPQRRHPAVRAALVGQRLSYILLPVSGSPGEERVTSPTRGIESGRRWVGWQGGLAQSPRTEPKMTTTPETPETANASPRMAVLGDRYRWTTIGVLLVISAVAFKGMGVGTAMPAIMGDIGSTSTYAWPFVAFIASSVLATVLGGRWADRRGPGGPLITGVITFAIGLVVSGLSTSFPPDARRTRAAGSRRRLADGRDLRAGRPGVPGRATPSRVRLDRVGVGAAVVAGTAGRGVRHRAVGLALGVPGQRASRGARARDGLQRAAPRGACPTP